MIQATTHYRSSITTLSIPFIILVFSIFSSLIRAQPESSDQPESNPTLIVPTQITPIDRTLKEDPPSPIPGSLADAFKKIDQAQVVRRAGLKASVLRQVQRIIPIVIIVDDPSTYLHAIEQWEGVIRFPILWDDGSIRSQEDIARFVRAFQPEHVYRLNKDQSIPWAGSRIEKQRIFEQSLSRAIDQNAPDWKTSLDSLAHTGIVSPGIVITDVEDPAWPAALALSAARLQPISFITKPDSPIRLPLTVEQSDSIERQAEHAAKQTGRTWKELGDQIDMITLALNTGTMIKTGGSARDRLSTTDRIGRTESKGQGTKWAWCGQIIGNESQSLYQAMCALFLEINQAFIWDGYANKAPWSSYDGTKASNILKENKFNTELHDQPRYTMKDWRLRMSAPIGSSESAPGSSGLFLMNSKGMSNAFYLPSSTNTQEKPGNIPQLDIPMALHIVHSFSLAKPMSRYTVGGRFLERGVYVYAGSVDEPYLNAFIPTPEIANRLIGSLAFASAVHYDEAEPWKITVIGDPLTTFGGAGLRLSQGFEIDNAIDLKEHSQSLLKEHHFEGAINSLILLGDDKSVSKLSIALMKEKPNEFTDSIALGSIPALFRESEYTRLLDAYQHLGPNAQSNEFIQDFLWLSAEYLMARAKADPDLYTQLSAILRANIRTSQSIEDAERLAMFLRDRSLNQAIGVLESLRPTLNDNQTIRLDKAITRVRK